ncbi:MAG: DUF3619 family protein [Burkholderiaceae bacterium]
MNEAQTAYAIRRELDRGAADLPDDISARLAGARNAALAAMPAAAPVGLAANSRHGNRTRKARRLLESPPLFQRLAIAGLPAVLLAVGLVSFSQWGETRRIEQMAELDAAVLLDDLPIAAYADRGFGVFLKNTRQWAALTPSHASADRHK